MYMTSSELTTVISRMQAMGVKWVRMIFSQQELAWGCYPLQYGPTGGGVGMDATVNTLKAASIDVLAIIGQTNTCSSTTGGTGWVPPKDVPSYIQQFVKPVVSHYTALGVHNWEVWNEPNGNWDWPPAANASQYTTLLCQSYAAIHAADPSANVLASLSGTYGTVNSGILDTTFLSQMYTAGARDCFDAVATHPYSESGPNLTLRGGQDNWGRMYASNPSILSIMTSHSDSAKKIWITELGCITGNTSFTWFKCTEQQLTQLITDAFNFSTNGFPNMGPIFWFEYQDVTNCSSSEPECYFGLYRADGSPKTTAVNAFTAAPQYMPNTPVPAASFTSSATISSASPVFNKAATITLTIRNTGTAQTKTNTGLWVYNGSGVQVFQKVYNNQTFAQNEAKTYTVSFTPRTSTGSYSIGVGVWNTDWSTNYHWNRPAGSFTVTSGSADTQAPSVPTNLIATAVSSLPCCMDRRCGRTEPDPCSGLCDADVLRASQLQHSVQHVGRDGHVWTSGNRGSKP